MNIYIVGSGKLANALLASNLSFPSCEVVKWDETQQISNEKAIVVHAGSGRQLKECIAFCARTSSVFIELSTGLESEKLKPDFPLIICPNTSILLLKTLHIFKTFGSLFKDYKISITESHQSTKVTEPGTAYTFANSLQFPINKIVSIRDPEVQLNKIGLPIAFLDKHAYHKIVIEDGNDEVIIETKVLGHDSYTNGVRKIIESVLNIPLDHKRYTILELIEEHKL